MIPNIVFGAILLSVLLLMSYLIGTTISKIRDLEWNLFDKIFIPLVFLGIIVVLIMMFFGFSSILGDWIMGYIM